MHKIVVVTQASDFPYTLGDVDVEVVPAREYLTGPRFCDLRNVRVFNLCRSYRYQAAGYYVSLLAEARGHRVVPNVLTIQDFKTQTLVRALSEDTDELIQQSLARITGDSFVLSIYFGRNLAKSHDTLARALYNVFEAPMLRAEFTRTKRWQLTNIAPISFKDIPENHRTYVYAFARDHFASRRPPTRRIENAYNLAILSDEGETAPPSDSRALREFVQAAERRGMRTQMIGRDDMAYVGDFDALFIRSTTSIANFTYRFARRAATEDLVVIDDPVSIARCGNKVYLAELLTRLRIPSPKTVVVHRDNIQAVPEALGYPSVLKLPDSSFSMGVIKVKNEEELRESLRRFFAKSDFIVAQEYMPTEFDWRIGILDGKPLYACKYFMARNHWQIYDWQKSSRSCGTFETLPIEEAPEKAVNYAARAAAAIGNGFYGVDVKQVGSKFYVIEVNDNPSVDAGVEDQILKDGLYDTVIECFYNRIRHKKEQFVL